MLRLVTDRQGYCYPVTGAQHLRRPWRRAGALAVWVPDPGARIGLPVVRQPGMDDGLRLVLAQPRAIRLGDIPSRRLCGGDQERHPAPSPPAVRTGRSAGPPVSASEKGFGGGPVCGTGQSIKTLDGARGADVAYIVKGRACTPPANSAA